MGNGFAPKEVIENGHHRLEILSAETTDTYGPQLAVKVKIVGGAHDNHQFIDYCTRNEDSGEVLQGSKGWSVVEACLGHGFHREVSSLEDALKRLAGRQFVAQVTQTKTGSRNRLEHGTIGPVPPGEDSGDSAGDGSGGPDGNSSLRDAQQASEAARDGGADQDPADDPEWERIPF